MITNIASCLRKGYLCAARPNFKTIVHKMCTHGAIEAAIRKKLTSVLNPSYLNVINESHMHNVPQGSETHFKVVIVTDKFLGLPLIKIHRWVNQILKLELNEGVHALSIEAKTPEQWENSEKAILPSPNCRGGFGL